MSQSPLEIGGSDDVYTSAWRAVNKLMRRGYSWSGHERNCAFLNLGDGTFARVDATSGFGYYDDGRAAARLDWDLDGDLDLLVTNRSGPRVRLLRNELDRPGEFLAVRLRGAKGNRDAIGARVTLHGTAGETLARTVRAGEGYLAQQSAWVHFGLAGLTEGVDRVTVRWPGGEEETFPGPAAGRRYELVQGSGVAARWDPPAKASRLEPSPLRPPEPTSRSRVVLPAPLIMPRLLFEGPAEGQVTATWGYRPGGRGTATGRPVLLNLWASWCAPCREELTALRDHADRLREHDLAVVALGVEQGEDRAPAAAMLEEIGWPYPAIFAAPQALDVLTALQGMLMDRDTPLPVPTSFLVDRTGSLLAMYFGPVDIDQVLADLALETAGPGARLAAAAPFPGDWGEAPAPLELEVLAARFAARGLVETEREIRLADTEVREQTRAALLHEFGREAGLQGRWEQAAEYLRQSLAEDPRRVDAWVDLGFVLYRLEKYREAVDAYRQALLRDPELPVTRANLGIALVRVGDRAGAEEQLRFLERAEHPSAEVLAREIETLNDGDR